MNVYEKNTNFKGKPSFKNWCNYCQRYGHSIAECIQKQQDNQNKPKQNIENPTNLFINTRRKDEIYPIKTFIASIVQDNSFQITPTTLDNNHLIKQNIEDDHHTKEIHRIFRKIDIVDHRVEIVNIKLFL